MTRSLIALLCLACAIHLAGCDLFVDAGERVERARRYVADGNDRGAFVELQNAVRQDPNLVAARLMLAELSLRLGDPNGAEVELAKAEQYSADPGQVAVIRADIALALGKHEQLLAAIQSDGAGLNEPMRSTFQGLIHARKADYALAIEAFEQALRIDPDFNRARVGLAEARLGSGDSDAALKALEIALRNNPKDAAASFARGNVHLRRGEFEAAASALEDARRNAAGQLSIAQFVAVLAALTDAHLGAGDVQQAEVAHGNLAALAPDAAVTRLLRARLAMAKHDYTSAVAEAQQLVNSNPELLPAKLLLSVALLAQGNLHQAETHLSDLVRSAPGNTEARKLLAKVNLQLQRPDVAMQLLTPLQDAGEGDSQLAAMLGLANWQRGDRKAGIALLEQGLAREPQNENLKQDLALAYMASGADAKALALVRSMKIDTPREEAMLVALLASVEGVPAAREQIQRFVTTDPSNVAVLNRAATYYAQLKDYTRARAVLEDARKLEPNAAATLVTLARVERAADRSTEAMQAAQAAVKADPSNVTARLMVADLAARAGDLDAAVTQLEEVRARDAQAIAPRLALAKLYLQGRKMREADSILRELEKPALSNAGVANAMGEVYRDVGRVDEALRWFREAARQDSDDPEPALNVARMQLAKGDPLARESLETLIRNHPDYLPAATELVLLDLRQGRAESARARVQKLKATHPNDVRVVLLEGEAAMSAKSYAEAAAAFESAAKSAPSGALAIALHRARRLGDLPRANEPLLAWLDRSPNDVAVRLVLAQSLEASGDTARAIEHYEILSQDSTPSPIALNNLAWLYHQRGDGRARTLAERAHQAAPGNPAIADTYGWILVQSGAAQQGLPILEQAASASSGQPDIRYHYAVALAKVGNVEAARRELTELLRTKGQYSVFPEAQKLLADLGG